MNTETSAEPATAFRHSVRYGELDQWLKANGRRVPLEQRHSGRETYAPDNSRETHPI